MIVVFRRGNFLKKIVSCGEVSSAMIIFSINFFSLTVSIILSVFSVSIVVFGEFVYRYFVGWF